MGLGLDIAASIIPGVGQVISQNMANKQATQQQDKTIAANKGLAEYQYGKDLEMWNRSNAYNAPTAQMQRLQDAGLNPNLVYGNGATATSSATLPKYQAPTVKYDAPMAVDPAAAIGSMQGGLSVLDRYQDYKMKSAQTDNLLEQKKAIQQGVVNAELQERLMYEDLPYRTSRASREGLNWRRDNALSESSIAAGLVKNQLTQDLAPYQTDLAKLKVQHTGASIDKVLQDIRSSKTGQEKSYQSIVESRARVANMGVQGQLLKSRVGMVPIQVSAMNQDIALKSKMTELKQKELDYYVQKMYTDQILRGLGTAGQMYNSFRKGKVGVGQGSVRYNSPTMWERSLQNYRKP
ncbi:DNA pilot protein [Blackfly microvirus SF02]|uniref:DNA pilot protein n=1 Tax=Blackfly microvirus SF02 TaxID=2576452 RepID=A0A4P8PUD5_9VIRU|nr:DNA pilot protein [Blackfly microvirus SF02]